MTRPENAESTETEVRSEESEVAAEDPAVSAPAASTPARKDPAPKGPSSNGAEPPVQRQRTAKGDVDQKTVRLQVGAPEHARGTSREQANRQHPGGRAHGFSAGLGSPVAEGATGHMPSASIGDQDSPGAVSPSTVRIGGYTPPERVAAAASTSARVRAPAARVPRRTSLELQRLEPWSVLKLSLVLSIAGFLAWMVAVGVLYGVLAGMGVWEQLNGTYSDLTSVNNPQGGTELISGGRVFGVALVVGLVNIVLMTALATVGSLIYNVAADLVGGVEVTLSEPD
ncbi:MAG TPA: DUF3566 domain-containing protein [Pseudonocardiaceae bacterium]|nr:DUF3566 domain-containing protein [Pseudonocardiaceae bacterium]